MTPLLKRLLAIQNPTFDLKVRVNFGKVASLMTQLLTFILGKKDANYIELFVAQIINLKPAYIELFADELLTLTKLKSEGGPKTDLHRLKGLQLISRTIGRILQGKDDSDKLALTSFLKGTSKECKKLFVSVCLNHETFKMKKISIIRGYLEFTLTLLRAYKVCGLSKRFKSLKETVLKESTSLPTDSTLAKTLKKINETVMEEGEEIGGE